MLKAPCRYSVRHPQTIRDEVETTKYCDAITSLTRKHDSLFCYQALDESAELLEDFALVKRVLDRIDPTHPSFSCLCNEGELPCTATMGTDMVIFDRYPLRKHSKPGDYDARSAGGRTHCTHWSGAGARKFGHQTQ